MPENTLFSYKTEEDESTLFNKDNPLWSRHDNVSIDRSWLGRPRIKEIGLDWRNLTQVSSLWNDADLFFYFQCWYDSLNIDREIAQDRSVRGLWERDVVEIFLKPEAYDDYFQIEVSPLGQWLDAHVHVPRVDVDFHWESKLKLAVSIEESEKIWRLFAALPFEGLMRAGRSVKRPADGEVWRLNLCRVAGEEPRREYLSWRPTFTPQPDFHVPSSFGNLFFLEDR